MESKSLKKLRKRCNKGLVNDYNGLVSCLNNAISWGKSSITFEKDKTRNNSSYDINLDELRDLLISICLWNTQTPKMFPITNRSFLRTIIIIHFSNCSTATATSTIDDVDTNNDTNDNNIEKAILNKCDDNFIIRIEKSQNSSATQLAKKLLSVAIEPESSSSNNNINAKNSNSKKVNADTMELDDVATTAIIHQYLLPTSMMEVFGYPCEIVEKEVDKEVETDIQDTSNISDANVQISSDEPSPKKLKVIEGDVSGGIDSEGLHGVYVGHVPPLSETTSIISSLPTSKVYCVNHHLNGQPPFTSKDFRKTWTSEQKKTLLMKPSSKTNVINEVKDTCTTYKVLALDCEMCRTVNGLELTRLSVVSAQGEVVLDTLVLPLGGRDAITDYHTAVSGISAATLEGVNVTFAQAQLAFLRLCDADTVLIGHSLENDLKCLRLLHPRCLDTAYSYPHWRGVPWRRKLKELAKEFLQEDIQMHDVANPQQGHDSIEDAQAALKLAKKKVIKGIAYGVPSSSFKGRPREHIEYYIKRKAKEKNVEVRMNFEVQTETPQKTDNKNLTSYIPPHLRATSVVREGRIMTSNDNKNDDDDDTNETIYGMESIRKSLQRPLDMATDLLFLGLNCDRGANAASLQSFFDVASTETTKPVLFFVTTQSSLLPYIQLERQKKACKDPKCSTIWTEEMENELKEFQKLYNLSKAGMKVINPPKKEEENEKIRGLD